MLSTRSSLTTRIRLLDRELILKNRNLRVRNWLLIVKLRMAILDPVVWPRPKGTFSQLPVTASGRKHPAECKLTTIAVDPAQTFTLSEIGSTVQSILRS